MIRQLVEKLKMMSMSTAVEVVKQSASIQFSLKQLSTTVGPEEKRLVKRMMDNVAELHRDANRLKHALKKARD